MKSTLIIMIAFFLSLIIVNDTSSENKSSQINVITKVLPVVKYEILHQEKNIYISEEDIKRGYVDVQDALIVSVMTNSTRGYSLTFFLGKNLFREVSVKYNSGSYTIRESDNEIHMPFEGMKHVRKELSFRFYFSDSVMPGFYSWPVAFMINAV